MANAPSVIALAPEVKAAMPVSPARQPLLDELAVLHEIFGAMNASQMPAGAWPRAKRVLDYLDLRITDLQGRADALLQAEIDEATLPQMEPEAVVPSKVG